MGMKTREEVLQLAQHGQARMVLEVLLDIRDLLASRPTPMAYAWPPPMNPEHTAKLEKALCELEASTRRVEMGSLRLSEDVGGGEEK